MTISKEINCAEPEYMNIGPHRSSGAPAMAACVMLQPNYAKRSYFKFQTHLEYS